MKGTGRALVAEEAAGILNVSVATIWRMARDKKLTGTRMLGRTVFQSAEVNALRDDRAKALTAYRKTKRAAPGTLDQDLSQTASKILALLNSEWLALEGRIAALEARVAHLEDHDTCRHPGGCSCARCTG